MAQMAGGDGDSGEWCGSGYAYRGMKAWLLLSDAADSVAPAITYAIPVMFALHSWRIWDICPLDVPFPSEIILQTSLPVHDPNPNSKP